MKDRFSGGSDSPWNARDYVGDRAGVSGILEPDRAAGGIPPV